jgi:epoxyqueuosine reductase
MCPTQAIVAPYVVDARRCISYLTIENKGEIPLEFRRAIGNRIYGCDDCQLVCPVNRAAPLTQQSDFQRRKQWQDQSLVALFQWDEATFLVNTEGSAIRRIGHARWQRNIAVALGNAPYQQTIVQTLQDWLEQPDHLQNSMVKNHVEWALAEQQLKASARANENRQQQRLIRIIEVGLPRDA